MKKALSLILAALMVCSALGATVFADEEKAEAEVQPTLLWDFGKDETELYDASSVEYEMGEDSVVFTAKGGDPNIKIKTDIEDVESIAWVKIRVKNPSPSIAVELFASTDGDNHALAGPECTHIDIVPYADEWQSYVAYLPNANIYTVNTFKGDENVDPIEAWNWQGACDYIRLDPLWRNTSGEMSEGDSVEIDYIAFFASKEDALAYAVEKDGDEETLGHAVFVPVEFEEAPEMPLLGNVMFANDSLRFIDIGPEDGDYYEAAKYVYSEGLFKGISDTRFGPDMTMTRAMFVTVLGRANFIDTEKYAVKEYSDVEPDAWYGPYVKWAADNGLVLGYEDGTFRPDVNLTIEQAAAIIARYAPYAGHSNEPVGDLSAYSDADDVSDWAVDVMTWAANYGVYTGVDGALTPKAEAPRKAVALMLYNFINAEFPAVVKVPVLGGWSKTESPVITEDQKAAFDKAMDGLVGVDYIPVAVLAQQVVSGTNYLFLCRSTVVVPDALEKFSFVTVYADLEGGAEVTDIVSTEIMTRIDPEEDGGWIAAESPDVPRAIAETYDTVSKGTAVEGYSPVACLASDADGQNYCLLCGDDAGYAFAYLHTPAEGDAELTEIFLLQE